MAEEGDAAKVYKFLTETGEEKKQSRDYTGKATAYYPNGDIYEGDFAQGIREGRGKYFYAVNGDKYEGEFR